MSNSNQIHAVLFDLDGTLADTAPDLTNALNKVRHELGFEALPLEQVRPHVSHGSYAIAEFGFAMARDHEDFEPLRARMLDHYLEDIADETTLFPHMDELLHSLEQVGIHWGIVTNKPKRYTDPLMDRLGLTQRAACIISGDSTPYRKPHPGSLLHACELTACLPQHCLYIGDAQRDIEAGLAAGTHTLVALFGYLRENDDPASWGAHGMVASAMEIFEWIHTDT